MTNTSLFASIKEETHGNETSAIRTRTMIVVSQNEYADSNLYTVSKVEISLAAERQNVSTRIVSLDDTCCFFVESFQSQTGLKQHSGLELKSTGTTQIQILHENNTHISTR